MKKVLTITLLVLLSLGLFVSCNSDAVATLFVSDGFTVTFNTNGGSNIASQTVRAAEKATIPTGNPTKDGYIFDGWYSDEALSAEYDFDTPVTENITVYAKWTPEPFVFKALEANSKVALTKVGTPADIEFEYSTDSGNWLDYSVGTDITLSAVDDKVFFRAKNASSTGSLNSDLDNGYRFTTSEGKVDVSGNIMLLADKEGKLNVSENAFAGLFAACGNLVNAENLVLPAQNLANSCYYSMFSGCTSLTTAPALNATTLEEGCYSSMFYGCTSLTAAPELPAMTMIKHCYNRMFYGCSGLEAAPALNATTLADWCYKNMFNGCTSLTAAPALPATALADYCYESMFQGCTSLTTVPELPATTLAGFCYSYMFSGCTNLSSVTVRLTSWNGNATENWLQGVAATGTFNCPSGLSNSRGTSFIPSGWSRQAL